MAGAGVVGARFVIHRRNFVGQGLILVSLVATRRLGAQGAAPLRYRPLARPVVVPLTELAQAWRARPFVAEAVTLASAAKANQPIRIAGMVARTAAPASGADRPDAFQAVSVRCPHEHCDCDFIGNPGTLPPEVVGEIGHAVSKPVYLCPCHNSVFKVEDGERLAGPAPRGLYRFRVTSVSATAIEIGEVEEDVLIFF
jgi:Rieske Fe-S protein